MLTKTISDSKLSKQKTSNSANESQQLITKQLNQRTALILDIGASIDRFQESMDNFEQKIATNANVQRLMTKRTGLKSANFITHPKPVIKVSKPIIPKGPIMLDPELKNIQKEMNELQQHIEDLLLSMIKTDKPGH